MLWTHRYQASLTDGCDRRATLPAFNPPPYPVAGGPLKNSEVRGQPGQAKPGLFPGQAHPRGPWSSQSRPACWTQQSRESSSNSGSHNVYQGSLHCGTNVTREGATWRGCTTSKSQPEVTSSSQGIFTFPVSLPQPPHPHFSAWESDLGSTAVSHSPCTGTGHARAHGAWGLCAPGSFHSQPASQSLFPVCKMGKV